MLSKLNDQVAFSCCLDICAWWRTCNGQVIYACCMTDTLNIEFQTVCTCDSCRSGVSISIMTSEADLRRVLCVDAQVAIISKLQTCFLWMRNEYNKMWSSYHES